VNNLLSTAKKAVCMCAQLEEILRSSLHTIVGGGCSTENCLAAVSMCHARTFFHYVILHLIIVSGDWISYLVVVVEVVSVIWKWSLLFLTI